MGSRWREMLMDYGQVLGSGDKSSRSTNSHVFSLESDLKTKTEEEMRLKRILDTRFRPVFQRYVYGGEKLACHDLRRMLRDPEYRQLLPTEKVHELADLADFNVGKAIKYDEFVRIVLGRPEDLSSFGSETGLESDDSYKLPGVGILGFICRNTQSKNMIQDKLGKYKCLPPPFFMITVTLVQIIVFIVYSTEATQGPVYGLENDKNAMYLPNRRREAWRFVTYCFVHEGYMDLIFCVILQLVIGFPLEIMFDFWRVAIVYFCGVITGSLGQSVADRYHGLSGAAGGTYAILAGHLVAMWQNRKVLNDDLSESKAKRVLCSLTLRAIFMLLIMAPQIALGVYRRWFYDDDDVNYRSGIASYIGGLVAGFLLSQAFLKDYKRYPWQDGAGWMDLFCYMIFVGACIIFNIAFDDYPPEDYS